MPALDVANPGASAVASVGALLEDLLDEASLVKQTETIEPALDKTDFRQLFPRISASLSSDAASGAENGPDSQESARAWQFAVIETAARDLFDKLIATTAIGSPEFVQMWHLFDILSILSDNGQCDPALLFWLVEELLDSQTIAGCRKIFDFLESRRERITAKHFKQKNLIILRSCNELLRRLSRAEDTAFCGRVFIFLFQSFPLGDRSSVNLRGEYHVENVTSYETDSDKDKPNMDVEAPAQTLKDSADPKAGAKGVSFGCKDPQQASSLDSLYPLFWSLQESFSQPLKLFDPGHFNKFKHSLDATMKAFQANHDGEEAYSFKSMETMKRDLRRKREGEGPDDGPEMFNPKYLTSKDLFGLEINDQTFRRHILVQALIITDFILSLSAGAKEKLASVNASNKSVIYNEQLNDENTKWANGMKTTISEYLKRGPDGPYFNRMVETVLARDKNWVFWKMASCPTIEREPVSGETFKAAKDKVQRMATSKRLRPTPMNAVPMDFLRDDIHQLAMENLQTAERYQLPDPIDFESSIADDKFQIETTTNQQTRAAAIAGISSKSWRALRIAARTKLAAFDKIEDPNNIEAIFQEVTEGADGANSDEDAARVEDMPENREPIIISGAQGVGKSTLVEKLQQQYKGVFGPVVRHTVREPRDGEIRGKSFHFVTMQEFSQLRDGDRLIESGARDGTEYGTSIRAVDAVTEAGKVPVIELDVEAAQFAKDMDFSARYVLVNAATPGILRDRLSGSGHDEAAIRAALAQLPNGTKPAWPFDMVVVNDDLALAAEALAAYVYRHEAAGGPQAQEDTSMADALAGRGGDDDARSDCTENRCIEVKL